MPDRDALAPGVRVQLSWIKHAPYTQRADLSVSDRLGTVIEQRDSGWLVEDDSGDRHTLDPRSLEVPAPDPAAGRWRIEGAIPAYAIGERLRLHWRHRSTARKPDPPREDCYATVVAEGPDMVTARLEDGGEIRLFRWGGQADEGNRQAPRWFVVGRG